MASSSWVLQPVLWSQLENLTRQALAQIKGTNNTVNPTSQVKDEDGEDGEDDGDDGVDGEEPDEDESDRDSSLQEMGKSHGGQLHQVLLRMMGAVMMVIVNHDLYYSSDAGAGWG